MIMSILVTIPVLVGPIDSRVARLHMLMNRSDLSLKGKGKGELAAVPRATSSPLTLCDWVSDIDKAYKSLPWPDADEAKYARSEDEVKDRSRRKRLRLKDDTGHRSSRRRSPRDRSRDRSRDRGHGRSSRHHKADDDRRRRRRRRRSRSPTPPNPHEEPPLDPEAAFRESLFDAMADDEGAAYWEGVYGQPIHVYSNERDGPQGELERMTDDEYAAYVRQKMWEKHTMVF
ncbi:unnamed protein product [Parascedosporium putredinis]|uniref:Uncharacterized protein n=1 Tax=Parascedosporium putredinis TaxID=1442378 RepID=A0A9P1MCL7_9PEZI|nr:unnamed protein product [Parascedosporium putredinis]CAI8000917.1 unnamed protein product [Parascedosporium putredinis]